MVAQPWRRVEGRVYTIGEVIDDRLRHLIARWTSMFRHQYASPEGADGQCAACSLDFNSELRDVLGVYATTADWYADRRGVDQGQPVPHPWFDNLHESVYRGHTCTLVDGWYIDFTARQFYPEAPYPLIWRTQW